MSGAMTKQIELSATVHEEDGMYWAEVPSHPGLFASGGTMDELIAALGEAWALYTSDDACDSPRPRRPAARSLKILVSA
jgi:predicted RNase H-like HicB family nuclease